MLKKIRLAAACICFVLVTLLFLDFTGVAHTWWGWLAKVQFIPALLALNAMVVVVLVLLTLLFGRVYCSVICPLGVFQDVVSHEEPFPLFSGRFMAALRNVGIVHIAMDCGNVCRHCGSRCIVRAFGAI